MTKLSRYCLLKPLRDPSWDAIKARVYYRGSKPARLATYALDKQGIEWEWVDAAQEMRRREVNLIAFLARNPAPKIGGR
jgi:hypothetical protein